MIDNRGVWGYLEEALKGMGFVVLLLVGLVLAFVLARQAGLPREMLPFIVVPPLYLLVCRLGRRKLFFGAVLLFVVGYISYAILNGLGVVDGLW